MNRQRLKHVVRLVTPPFIFHFRNHIRSGLTHPEWEYVPAGWNAAGKPEIKGWAQKSILDANISRWDQFVESLSSTLPFGVSPEATRQDRTNLSAHNLMMSYAYALSIAAAGKSQLFMLDWGGGIGHYYLISKTLRPDLNIAYACKDFRLFTEYGRTMFPEAHFYDDESWKLQQFDFVLASGSLHYSEHWRSIFMELVNATKGYLFITRLPVIHDKPSYVMVQRPYHYGYDTEYLGWCINRQEIIDLAENAGLTLIREFVVENAPYIHKAPEQCDYWGFLFRKK